MYKAALKYGPITLTAADNLLGSLCREIIGQQLSGKVAATIYERFQELFRSKYPTPKEILEVKDQNLRDVGMSWAKVKSLKDLAINILEQKLDLEKLKNENNEAVVLQLTKIKGIGPWTAEMFLMFALGREDVFSPSDLGLRNAVFKLYNLNEKLSNEKLLNMSYHWAPYRTYASIILWRSLDNFTPPGKKDRN